VRISQGGGKLTRLSVMGGFLQVASNVVRIGHDGLDPPTLDFQGPVSTVVPVSKHAKALKPHFPRRDRYEAFDW